MKTLKMNVEAAEQVKVLQRCLNGVGNSLEVNGCFDESVQRAVMDFQRSNGLVADGVVGFRTWQELLLGKGGEGLAPTDCGRLALLLDCEPAALKAVQMVETGGRGGFLEPGKPLILFEGHVFWKQLAARGIDPEAHCAANGDILYRAWTKVHYRGGLAEYDRLERARSIDREAADASASWGMFQIMGFNFKACGEDSVADFVRKMCDSELQQLALSAAFIRNAGMLPALQNKDWADFARRYNGPEYAKNRYDVKLEKAYRDALLSVF